MDSPRHSFTTTRNVTYSYIHTNCDTSTSKQPTILFLHGFPSIAVDFDPQITHFSSLGYGILAPDLIGYGASSRPTNARDYKHKLIVNDLVELLDSLLIDSVIGLAHDFGSQVLTRLEFHHPTRVDKLIFLTIGPIAVGQEFDLDTVNEMTRRILGYEGFGYQDFLTRDTGAPELLATRSRSFHDLIFTRNYSLWKEHFGKLGGLKRWLQENRRCDTILGFNGRLSEFHEEAFGASSGGYEGAKNWYIGLVHNHNIQDDHIRLNELGLGNKQPYQLAKGKKVLLITATEDVIATPAAQEQMTHPYLGDPASDLTVYGVKAGHWVGIEKADEVNDRIENFLAESA